MAKKIIRNEGKSRPEKGAGKQRKESKNDKPKFQRYKDDARPSDFGTSRHRPDRNTGSKPARKYSERPEKREDSEKRPERNFSEKKPAFKKPYRKEGRPEFKRSGPPKKKEANPFDLDEQDFQYEEKPAFTAKRTVGKGPKRSASGSGRSSSSDGTVRLNKYIANAGICSRREADDLISSGVVQVNGITITEMGYKVKPTDIVKYGGQTLKKERMVYLLLNKPKDYITTVDDPEKRRTVLELVQGACRERIYPVGRLDRATTGLLLFTNDGELTKRLTHPRYGVRKIYHVELDKPMKQADMDKVAEGIELEDGPIQVDEISFVGNGQNKKEVGVELHSGRNRVVRRIFETLGYNVRKLDRVMFGPLTKKDMPRGRWRFLTEAEVGMLKMVSAGKD